MSPSVAGMALLLLLVELLVRTPLFWNLVPQSSSGIQDAVIAESLKLRPNPDVIVLGSSLFRSAIAPPVVDNAADLPDGTIANWSFSTGSPFDYVRVYEKHRDTFREARLLVISTESWHYNLSMLTKMNSFVRFRRSATLTERLRVPGRDLKADLLLGWVCKTWDARPLLRGYFNGAIYGDIDRTTPVVDEIGRIGQEADPATKPTEAVARQITQLWDYADFKYNEVHLDALRRLLEMAREDGLEVVLLVPAMSPPALDEIRQGFAATDRMWRNRVESTTGLPVEELTLDTPECADWTQCFFDFGHLNTLGAMEYSRIFAQWLVARYPALMSEIR